MLNRPCYAIKVSAIDVVESNQQQYLKAAHEAIFNTVAQIENESDEPAEDTTEK
jgi:hypothetical protein